MKYLLFVLLCFSLNDAVCQSTDSAISAYFIKPVIHNYTRSHYPSHIDAVLFSSYLDGALQKDSLPAAFRSKSFTIDLYYIISKEGKINEVKPYLIKKEDEAVFEFVRTKLLQCPLQWSPAYQNGRAVKDFVKLKIVGNGS